VFDGRSSLRVLAVTLGGLLGPLAVAGGHTEPGGGEGLRIAVFGDSGSGNPDQKAVARQLRRFEDELRHVLLLGDNVYWTGRAERFDEAFFRPYRRFLERRAPSGERQILFHSALGNHDVRRCARVRREDGSFARGHEAYAWREEGCDVEEQLAASGFGYREAQRYYFEGLRDARGDLIAELYVLDSNTLPSEKRPEERDEAQLEWLVEALRASRQRARASGSEPWRILILHHPIRTPTSRGYIFGKGGHGEDPVLIGAFWSRLGAQRGEQDRLLEAQIEPLLERGTVDVVFAGHNHFYARTVPGSDRIRHFVSGGGGIPVSEPQPDANVAVGGGFHHFVTAVLTRERFEYCTIDSLGRIRDHGYWLNSRPEDDDRPLEGERYEAVCRP